MRYFLEEEEDRKENPLQESKRAAKIRFFSLFKMTFSPYI